MTRVGVVVVVVAALFVSLAQHAGAATAPAKLWATDLPAFLNERPGEWVVGHSLDPALSAAEAESFARADAAGPVFQKLCHRLPQSSWPMLLQQIQDTLSTANWVVDRQVEAQDRPYGTIWRASVLVDASPQRLERLLGEVERDLRRQRDRLAVAVASAVVAGVFVFIFYFALNWLTRGFFRGRLMTASAMILAGWIFAVVHLI